MADTWDPVARDAAGAALSAGEVCQRDGCLHRWLDHDHISCDLNDRGFGWCMIVGVDGGRCSCLGFVAAPEPVIAPTPFALPFPPRHAKTEP